MAIPSPFPPQLTGFHFRRSFKIASGFHVDANEPGLRYTERTPIRQGRSMPGSLLAVVLLVGLLLAAIAFFA